jgi:hypothetical protein
MLRFTMLVAAAALASGFSADDKSDLDAKFANGSIWKGTVKERKAGKELSTDLVITITKRDGIEFEGNYENFEGANIFSIDGTIDKGILNFTFNKVIKGEGARNILGVKVKGTVSLDPKTKKPILTATYSWPDANNPKVVARGTIHLKLDE